MDTLDNPIWNALRERHAHLAEGDDIARRYPRSFSPLAGIKEPSVECFNSLESLVEGSEHLGLCFSGDVWIPDSWHCTHQFLVSQMVCDKLANVEDTKDDEIEILGASDVPEMKKLVELTQPGPFSDRTIEFGDFFGIKKNGKLVAMTGERIKVPASFDEVSGVCTHPDFQGKGYAKALVYKVAKAINDRDCIPFLHVRSDNVGAIHTYEKLGFKTRRELSFAVVRPIRKEKK